MSLYTFKALYFAFSSHQVCGAFISIISTFCLDQVWLPDPYPSAFFDEKVQLCQPVCVYWLSNLSFHNRISKYNGLDVC